MQQKISKNGAKVCNMGEFSWKFWKHVFLFNAFKAWETIDKVEHARYPWVVAEYGPQM